MSGLVKKLFMVIIILKLRRKKLKSKVMFHGYTILRCGTVLSKSGQPLKTSLRKRRGGKFDVRVSLCVNGKQKHFTLSRLVLECFDGPMYGYEANHKDRDTMNNHIKNLERLTASENQIHWRKENAKN